MRKELKVEKNRNGKKRMKWRCCYFVSPLWCYYFVSPLPFNLSGLGGPNRSIKTPVSIAIWVSEVHMYNRPHHGDGKGGNKNWKMGSHICWN